MRDLGGTDGAQAADPRGEQGADPGAAAGVRRRTVRGAFLAQIVHALEDGILIQRMLTPDEVRADAVVDSVELLLDSWAALGTAER